MGADFDNTIHIDNDQFADLMEALTGEPYTIKLKPDRDSLKTVEDDVKKSVSKGQKEGFLSKVKTAVTPKPTAQEKKAALHERQDRDAGPSAPTSWQTQIKAAAPEKIGGAGQTVTVTGEWNGEAVEEGAESTKEQIESQDKQIYRLPSL